MQPYFFPHPGYFDLMRATDFWVVFDTPAFSRKGWTNRNRILHPSDGWQWLTVPLVKAPLGTPINAMAIDTGHDWWPRMRGQIDHYRKHAPHFDAVVELLASVCGHGHARLADLNIAGLKAVADLLGLRLECAVFSEMDLDIGDVDHPGGWALEIATALNADTYVNPPGGADLFDPRAFAERGIDLEIRDMPPMVYDCGRRYGYEPRLSIVDVLMWTPPEQVAAYLDAWARPHPGAP